MELLVVMAIVGVIALIATPIYTSHLNGMAVNTAIKDIKLLEVQIGRYFSDTRAYPDSLTALGIPIPLDPWGNRYQYLNIADAGTEDEKKIRKDKSLHPLNTDYDLYSMGPDGDSRVPLTAAASHDDIVRAGNGGFVGPAVNY